MAALSGSYIFYWRWDFMTFPKFYLLSFHGRLFFARRPGYCGGAFVGYDRKMQFRSKGMWPPLRVDIA